MDTVMKAVADPTRRSILDLLSKSELVVKAIQSQFSMSQPAISQHLRLLKDAGLVNERKAGRERVYSLNAEPLRLIYDWAGHYEKYWTQKMNILGDLLQELEEHQDGKDNPTGI